MKTIARRCFEAIPFHQYLESSWRFIRTPEINNERSDTSTIINAWPNLIHSLFLLIAVAVVFQNIFPGTFSSDVERVINPVYLPILLTFHSIAFSLLLTALVTVTLWRRVISFHHAVTCHCIQFFSITNPIFTIFIWIIVNRAVVDGDVHKPINNHDFWFTITAVIALIFFAWRLMLSPLWSYFSNYFGRLSSLVLVLIVLSTTIWISSKITIGDGTVLMNRKALCEELYELQYEQREGGRIDRKEFLTVCKRL
jgi:hypothetical protein